MTFEGTEGSGKTTQIELLAQRLRDLGYHVVATREPGGTALGESLRAIVLGSDIELGAVAEAYLMTAARAEHVRTVIRPALLAGHVVLCDRFVDSTLAYQGAGRGLPIEELRRVQQLAVADTWPDATVLLDVPTEIGLARRAADGDANRIDRETIEFHQRVATWFRAEATANPARWIVVDGRPDVREVHERIFERVMSRRSPSPLARP